MMAAQQKERSLATVEDCLAYIAELETGLREAAETLEAIRAGEVDAVVVSHPEGIDRVYTLENADRPYRVLIEQMHEGAVTLGKDGTVLYCNRRFAEMVRLPHEHIIGSDMERFVRPADRPIFSRLMQGSAARGERAELTLIAADGMAVAAYLSLIELAMEGEPVICGVVADLSEQKEHARELQALDERLVSESAERELAEAQLRQAQKMEVVGQLTGGIAHDFNNLLTVIAGNLQLARDATCDEKLARRIGAALLATERGAQLTKRLLAFSRQQSLSPEVIRVSDLLSGMKALVRRTIGQEIEIEVTHAPDTRHCRADRNQLEAALLNLVINARDAMPAGGRLVLAADYVELDEGAAAGMPEASPGSYVRLSVADTGQGMLPEVAARAFEPFFTTKDVGKGTGLGLSQVYGFVRQSGGAVTIESEPGKGTRVSLYLPSVESSAVEGRGDREADVTVPVGRLTVLVVEDDPAVRLLTAELIEGMGHVALAASDGPEALAVMDHEPDIGLVVTDVVMPHGMSGIELARELQCRRPGLPILLSSGFTAAPVISELSAESFEIIWKPYRQEELARAISAAVARAKGQAQPARAATATRAWPRILIVEDDVLIAMLLEQQLIAQGCEVVGPLARLEDAMDVALREHFDAALLDVRLGDRLVYPLADALAARGVRFAFMTGYGEAAHPAQYQGCPHLAKPYDPAALEELIKKLLA